MSNPLKVLRFLRGIGWRLSKVSWCVNSLKEVFFIGLHSFYLGKSKETLGLASAQFVFNWLSGGAMLFQWSLGANLENIIAAIVDQSILFSANRILGIPAKYGSLCIMSERTGLKSTLSTLSLVISKTLYSFFSGSVSCSTFCLSR